MTRISVCIPTYNYGRYLPDAIDSVLSQTLTDFELIISDNCSSDNTQVIVKDYLSRDNRIKYFVNNNNIGLIGNLNKCLFHAKGEYIKFLCADDVLDSTCLEKLMSIFDKYPNVELVTCARLLVDENLRPISTLSFSNNFQVLTGVDVINQCLLYGNVIGEPSAVMFRKVNAANGFSENYKQLSDLDMWFRILEKGDFASLPEALCNFRQHSAQGTKINIKSLAFADDEFNLLNKYIVKDYIKLSFIEKQKARYNKAYIIWHERSSYPFNKMVIKISQHYSILLFAILLGAQKVKTLLIDLLKIWDFSK